MLEKLLSELSSGPAVPGIKVGGGISQTGPQEEHAVSRQWQRSREGEGTGEGAGLSRANPNASF